MYPFEAAFSSTSAGLGRRDREGIARTSDGREDLCFSSLGTVHGPIPREAGANVPRKPTKRDESLLPCS